jgi:FKBP-type peptidyl-prolyl cis-trans isomerase FkpA
LENLHSGVEFTVILVRSSRPFLALLLGMVLLGAAAACNDDSPVAPSDAAPFSQTDVRVGTGAEATGGGTVTVHYSGWLYNPEQPNQKGAQFESSVGRTPFTFTLGVGQVIEGWDQGVVGMRVGGLRRLVIPPTLAYGDTRNGPIPPNATLLFEIELLEVQ